MNTTQAYHTLNLDSASSYEDIKYAYRKLALELHPDKNSQESEGIKFKQVTEAYHFLKNNHKRLNSQRKNFNPEGRNKNEKKNNESSFRYRKTEWGAPPPGGSPPEEDWGRFTREFEEANPNFWKLYEKEFWENYDARKYTNYGTGKESAKTKKNEPKINLSVHVDPSLCIGCCSCETIAPEVFRVDKLSKLNPKSKAYNEKGAGYNKIMNAAETCPTKAIIVEDKDTNERLFPW